MALKKTGRIVDGPKKPRGMRLTDDEWTFVKEAVKKYRAGEEPARASLATPSNDTTDIKGNSATYKGNSEVALLSHLEYLYQQDCIWLLEYEQFLTDDFYRKHNWGKIQIERELIQLQIMTLLPHLDNAGITHELNIDHKSNQISYITGVSLIELDYDIKIKRWQVPDNIETEDVAAKLLSTFQAREKILERVKELERKQHEL